MLSASERIPGFSIRFLPIDKTRRLGVPYNPFAISATPNEPSPQLLISKTSRE